MLPVIGFIIFDCLLLWWLGKWIYHSFLLSADGRKRLLVEKLQHQFEHKRQWDRDLLKPNVLADLNALISEARTLIKDKANVATVDAWMKEASPRWHRVAGEDRNHWPREIVEVLVVVIGVVMGLRGLYLQPFKIPTGSMRPTLFGIHFTPTTEPQNVSWPRRFLDGINYSRRYVDVVAEEDLVIPLRIENNQPGSSKMVAARGIPVLSFFLPTTRLLGEHSHYDFPGDEPTVLNYLTSNHPGALQWHQDMRVLVFKKGDVIARGYYQLGDHLFVDRVSFQFREPVRGDITVFITDGIVARGNDLKGRYYIKRLVGLPGDTLRIRDRKLYVKEKGAADFRLVDATDHPAFERVCSFKGGNRGYSHDLRARYLTDNDDIYELKEDEYFMLGDNSENSADSRFWGVVHRGEIVGRAMVVYWPFLRRWGLPDRVPAEEFPSPPSY